MRNISIGQTQWWTPALIFSRAQNFKRRGVRSFCGPSGVPYVRIGAWLWKPAHCNVASPIGGSPLVATEPPFLFPAADLPCPSDESCYRRSSRLAAEFTVSASVSLT